MVLFAMTGCAALIYELAWFQLLELVIGSSALSLTILLATFMGGMCVGSLLFPRLVSTNRNPFSVYGFLEIAIGISAAAVLVAMPLAASLQAMAPVGDIALRCLIAAAFLTAPTLLIGATFPAIARIVDDQARPLLGYLYAANITGAVIGCLVAGFYLLRIFDTATASNVAVVINTFVGLIALSIGRASVGTRARENFSEANGRLKFARGERAVYAVIGSSGFTAMGAEIIWTRQLSLVFGATVYTFSIVLAALLTGIGIGTFAGSYVVAKGVRPRGVLTTCQFCLTAAIVWTSWAIAYSLPYSPVRDPSAWSPWVDLTLDFIRCFWAIFPAAFLWGASFPSALGALASSEHDSAELAGGVYAANTLGAIAAVIIIGVYLIPGIGTHACSAALIALSTVAGLIMVHRPNHYLRNAAIALPAIAVMLAVVNRMPPTPDLLVAYGRNMTKWVDHPPDVKYVGEGLNSSVAVSEWSNGIRNFHVAGKVEASTQISDMRLQRMLGHLSALMHREPRSVLVVGFGAGVTAGTFVVHPGIERIVICEIEPLIPEIVSSYFTKENYDVARDPRVKLVLDDARHYLLTTDEKFDIITSDPIHPWVKGAATLYTREYFNLVAKHLNPGGIISQWVPLYDSTEEVVKSEFATFFQVFPRGTVWSNDIKGRGYDVLLVGEENDAPIDLDQIAGRLDEAGHDKVVTSLREVGFSPALSLFSTYAGEGQSLKRWLENSVINSDRNLRLQYVAGLAFRANEPDRIYQNLLAYRTFPEELFTGSESRREAIRKAVEESAGILGRE
jgi:spermidine synthase